MIDNLPDWVPEFVKGIVSNVGLRWVSIGTPYGNVVIDNCEVVDRRERKSKKKLFRFSVDYHQQNSNGILKHYHAFVEIETPRQSAEEDGIRETALAAALSDIALIHGNGG